MAQANENEINGLKANCKRGYTLAKFWGEAQEKTEKLLLQSWRLVEDLKALDKIAWETVGIYSRYKVIDSFRIGIVSNIDIMIIPEKTYTNKKGQTKTSPEERVPSHYTQGGVFLGRVSKLGEKPISYPIELEITPYHFDFVKVGDNLEDCFHIKDNVSPDMGANIVLKKKELSRNQLKEWETLV